MPRGWVIWQDRRIRESSNLNSGQYGIDRSGTGGFMEKKKTGVSRQTLWQRKHRALGLCVVCSEPAYKGWRCVKHYEQHKIVMRLRYIPKVRGRYDVGGSSEFLEAAERAAKKAAARRKDGKSNLATLLTAAKSEPTAAPAKKRATARSKTPRSRKASL